MRRVASLALAVVAAATIMLTASSAPADAGPYRRLGAAPINTSLHNEPVHFASRTGWVNIFVRCAGYPEDGAYAARWANVIVWHRWGTLTKSYWVRCDGVTHRLQWVGVPVNAHMVAEVETRTGINGPIADPIGYGFSVWGDGRPIT
jgi:hypothetical protein